MHQFQTVSGFRSAMMASNVIQSVFLDLGTARAVLYSERLGQIHILACIRERGTETGLTHSVCLCVSLK